MAPTTKQIVLLLQRTAGRPEVVNESDVALTVLPHPKGRVPVVYVDLAGEIFELQSVQPKKYGSWFVNQKVSSNAQIYLASRVDPLLLCLPYFETRTQYSPLDQIVTAPDDAATSSCARLPLAKAASWHLENISDVKDLGDDLVLYKYNEEKTLAWLSHKVRRAARHLLSVRKARATVDGTVVSSFNMSAQAHASAASSSAASSLSGADAGASAAAGEPEAEDIRAALQVVTDYLTDAMATKLVAAFGLTAADVAASKTQAQKRKADWEIELEIEKETNYALPQRPVPTAGAPSTGNGASKPAPAAAAKKTATSASAAKTAAAAKGAKSITSFFGKK
jgi:hypothetical protein